MGPPFCLFAYLAGLFLSVCRSFRVCLVLSGFVVGRDGTSLSGMEIGDVNAQWTGHLIWSDYIRIDRVGFIGILGGVVIPEYTDPWRMTEISQEKNSPRLS